MTREQAAERAKILNAYARGAEIQWRPYHSGEDKPKWNDRIYPQNDLTFDFVTYEYRIKPEPLKLWAVKRYDGLLIPFTSYEEAKTWKNMWASSCCVREFIETSQDE